MEKTVKPASGLLGFIIILLTLAASIYLFLQISEEYFNAVYPIGGGLLLVLSIFFMRGLNVIQPNHTRVLNFFGKYAGTVKDNGWFFVNPFYTTENISLRSQNLESARLKVNDKMGNPIEIAEKCSP